MKKSILFVHSAGGQDDPNEGSNRLLAYIKSELSNTSNLIHPKMPNPVDPTYTRWRNRLKQELDALDGDVLLIGHSLGGSVLLKYLSENMVNLSISGLFVIAAPYWGKDEEWQREEFELPENDVLNLTQIDQLCFYHGQNDKIVPHSHLRNYRKKFPQATTHLLEDADHYFSNGLPMLIDDIRHSIHKEVKTGKDAHKIE